MANLSLLSDGELLERLPVLVRAEREATAEVIEHLVEVERRRLYLEQACANLAAYCRERLEYAEDAAYKRARVAEVAIRFPRALDELRSGRLHLTALLLLSPHLTEANADTLFTEARGKSCRAIVALLAGRFPQRPEAPKVQALHTVAAGPADTASGPSTPERRSGAEPAPQFQLETQASSYRYSFTASADFHAKLERARELASHAVPSGDVAAILERALDKLIDHEEKRRLGSGKRRKQRALKPGSRHVPRDRSAGLGTRRLSMRVRRRRGTALHRTPFPHARAPAAVRAGRPGDCRESLCFLRRAQRPHSAPGFRRGLRRREACGAGKA